MCRCDVQTYCFGLAASMGAFLLGAGTKGKRYSMPNARIMIHQPLGGASGQASAFRVPRDIDSGNAAFYIGRVNLKVARRQSMAHLRPVCLCGR